MDETEYTASKKFVSWNKVTLGISSGQNDVQQNAYGTDEYH